MFFPCRDVLVVEPIDGQPRLAVVDAGSLVVLDMTTTNFSVAWRDGAARTTLSRQLTVDEARGLARALDSAADSVESA